MPVIIWHESYPPWYTIPSGLRIWPLLSISCLRRLIETACLVFSQGLNHSLPLNDAILASTKTVWIVKVICKLFCTNARKHLWNFKQWWHSSSFTFLFKHAVIQTAWDMPERNMICAGAVGHEGIYTVLNNTWEVFRSQRNSTWAPELGVFH